MSRKENQMIQTTKNAEKKSSRLPHLRTLFTSISKSQYFHLIACFLIPSALMLLIYLCRGIHPFGDESVLVLDLNGQYVYFYEALRDFVWGDGSLLYSFSFWIVSCVTLIKI